MSIPITWKRRWVEELIYLFYEQRCLWDADCAEHTKVKDRENALKMICEKLRCDIPKLTPFDVRAKIFNLRSQFRKQENQLNTETTVPTLWCYDLLKFLKPVLRQSQKSISEDDSQALINGFTNGGDCNMLSADTIQKICAPSTKLAANIQAKSWAVEYQKLSSEQKILAKRKIDYILFQGRFGHLEKDSEQSVFSTINSSNNELMFLLKSMNTKFERMEREILENKRLLTNNKTLIECKDLTKKIYNKILSLSTNEACSDLDADFDTDIAIIFPIVNLDDIDSIERRLMDITYSDAILDYMRCLKVGSHDIDGVFKKMVTDEVVQHYNWNGRSGKKALENLKLFNNLLREIFEPMHSAVFEKQIKKSIEMSHCRMKRKRYNEKEKTKNINMNTNIYIIAFYYKIKSLTRCCRSDIF